MTNKFCRFLSNGYAVTVEDGSTAVRPCCFFVESVPLNSDILQNHRNTFGQINGWTDNCLMCKDLEDMGQPSLRQSGPDWIPDHADDQYPITLDIGLDTYCNAACVICNEVSSTLWEKEKNKLSGKTIKIKNSTEHVDDVIGQIVKNIKLDRLTHVKFYGGEPFFSDTHLKFINHIPHPEQVTLHYTTNGSIYPNKQTLEAWKKFKLIIFAASLDGIEQQFDYLRWPLSWDKVSDNLQRIRENKDIWNIMFRVEFTANFLNVYYFDRLENWIKDNFNTNSQGDLTELNVHHVYHHSSKIWNADKMPEKMRLAVLSKYAKNHIMHNLVANLPPPQPMDDWHNFVNTWDLRRKNNWQTAFPDLVSLM
jgi:sulfatase maturation enzyme AslB (radical SAM superfamily)